MKKFIFKLAVFAVALMLPFASLFAHFQQLPNLYMGTFMGITSKKIDLLNSIEGEKIVIAGGSNLAYGVSCETISNELNIPAFNMGTTAYVGLPFMLSQIKPYLNEGDTVILSLENSIYNNRIDYNTVLMALENHNNVWENLPATYYYNIARSYIPYISSKIKDVNRIKEEKKQEGISENEIIYATKDEEYLNANFNTYGDYNNPYESNILEKLYNELDLWELNEDTVDESVIKELNDFKKWADKNGVDVFLTYATFNRLALGQTQGDDAAMQGAIQMEKYLLENCDIEWLGNFTHGIMDEKYFSNTNNHLNLAGRQMRTDDLINQYNMYFNNKEN